MDLRLTNFIKYCLGYIKLTRQHSFQSQQKYSINLSNENFSLLGLLNGEIDGHLGELINLEAYYKYDPLDVPDELKSQYLKEKQIASKLEEIYNKYRNDQFTKQIILNFGYFEVEIPKVELDIEEEVDEEETNKGKSLIEQKALFNVEAKDDITDGDNQKEQFPLFSLPIKMEKDLEKYTVYYADPDVQVNIGMLEELLGEDLYYQLVEKIGQYEVDGKLSLPFVDDTHLQEIWQLVKSQLKLKDVIFNDDSFNLSEVKIALSPRANYFLAEDLRKLSELDIEQMLGTALTSWVDNTDLNIDSKIPEEKDLFFPFPYDKYKLQVLSIVNNKASIVQGPPGTGKSETIANLLCHFAANGKKVLFVSQKTQALKVVKDKLKKLNIKYLYGYIPNPLSEQSTEQDETDGVAVQLASFGSYIQNMGFKVNTYYEDDISNYGTKDTIAQTIDEKTDLKQSFNESLELQREFWKLKEEYDSLEKYFISLDHAFKFKENFDSDNWKVLQRLEESIKDLESKTKAYAIGSTKNRFDRVLKEINLEEYSYVTEIVAYKEDVSRTGFDRHSNILRNINNSLRKIRLSKYVTKLPREINDYINGILEQDLSKHEAVKKLNEFYSHLNYYEEKKQLKEMEEDFVGELSMCGISYEQFEQLKKLCETEKENIESIKKKIIRSYEIKSELDKISSNTINTDAVTKDIKQKERVLHNQTVLYIQNIINNRLSDFWRQGVTIKQIVQKLGKAFGQSKRAFKTFDALRRDPNNFNTILDLIPVWIMELDDASRIIPLQAAMFDYVILDEASQCNVAYTLPVMFRAKKVLFVGDSEQMRDTTVMFKSNRAFDDLARRYNISDDLQIKATGTSVQSVLEIAKFRGFTFIPLRYHYRSPSELIGFSNKYFYKPKDQQLIALNNNYLTYKDTNRIMLIHKIKSDFSEEISDKVNIAEARAILAFFEELKNDPLYSDKSVGILTFFNHQATYLRNLFRENGYDEDKDNYKVSIIEGIQGDEKDIVLYSFVIRDEKQKNKYIPLTGEKGDIRADINNGRVNVAFSRAKLQVHCFVSIDEMPEGIWLKKYLQYVDEFGEVDFYSKEIKPFDSYFEKEFYGYLKNNFKKSYIIQNQVESCGFKIDFVITNTKSGKKLAIECDGPTHFKDEIDEAYGIYVESDEERQAVLEAAGWIFYRIKYTDWINKEFDKALTMKELSSSLE